ncbi:MAG: Rid family hydrolase [Acidimicrobiales bacterium]
MASGPKVRRCANPSSARTANSVGPYSHGIDADPFVYCSGQTVDPATGSLDGDGARTHRCFDNLFSVLEAAGPGRSTW